MTGYADSIRDNRTKHSQQLSESDLQLNILHNDLHMPAFKQAVENGSILAVSDGSFMPDTQIGAAAWVLEEPSTGTSIIGAMPTVGQKDLQNPCRSEITGIYFLLLHLFSLCKTHQITTGHINIHCDGLSAIQRLEYYRAGSFISGPNFDVVNAITALRDKIPLTIEFHHIKGHQDKGSAYNNLTRLAQLNVLVDHHAKAEAARQLQRNTHHYYESLPFSPCDVFIFTHSNKNQKLISSLTKVLKEHLTIDTSRTYWIKKHKMENWSRTIDWELRKKSLSNTPMHRQRWLSKYSTGFCGVGKMLRRYRWQDHTRCPRCNQDNESTQHILQCQGDGVQTLLREEITSLEKWMEEHKCHSELTQLICTRLGDLCRQTCTIYHPSNQLLQKAMNEQRHLGWFQFILGFWSRNFYNCQKEHMASQQSNKSPQLLLTKLQRRIWHIAWKAWEHRNNFLHEDNNSYHPEEIKLIKKEIEQEWGKGLEAIPQQYGQLFQGSMESLLKKKHTAKLKWLTTVWSLREAQRSDYFLTIPTIADPLTWYRYMRWKDNQT